MTIGHLFECMASKLAALTGATINATAFAHDSIEAMADALQRTGFNRYGNEVLYHGMTGEPLAARVFIGPVYYQRLKHMVADKMHARPRGKIVGLTRQPNEGRASGGGLRWGEMERDVGIVHGAAGVLHERMLISSDLYEAPVCSGCGLIGTCVRGDNNELTCNTCKTDNIRTVNMPYASKLLLQELMSMGIAPRIRCKKDP